ncbi:hypothetical protein M408DRAFT_162999 [Serendipita vermifera MAFF 305830]|uniref:Secreted protein n=1 Tax=Serendipita vermifera MAFF 305830 TaxID=933852 RepID=A0A0C3B6D3_SERVB|nr:hypothetical protein M408DRAFT_162999 [Serendipita vermifera MAFF 305830]
MCATWTPRTFVRNYFILCTRALYTLQSFATGYWSSENCVVGRLCIVVEFRRVYPLKETRNDQEHCCIAELFIQIKNTRTRSRRGVELMRWRARKYGSVLEKMLQKGDG